VRRWYISFGGFSFDHDEVVGQVVHFIETRALNALIAKKELVEFIPCFLGGLESANVSSILRRHCYVDHVEGGGVELVIEHLPP
jgi:hypothetical protein